MCYSIYKLTIPDGRAYIGLSSKENLNSRWRSGWGYQHKPEFFSEIQTCGWGKVKREILGHAETLDEARDMEAEFILMYKTYKPELGFNIQGKKFSKMTTEYLCKETGEIFPSMAAAGKFCGRTRAAVSAALKRDRPVGGYHFIAIQVEKILR